MAQRLLVIARTCLKCGFTFTTTAAGIKAHAASCEGS